MRDGLRRHAFGLECEIAAMAAGDTTLELGPLDGCRDARQSECRDIIGLVDMQIDVKAVLFRLGEKPPSLP